MTSNAADASPAPSACSSNKDMGVIGFATPLRHISSFMIFNKWEIKITVKNISSRQPNGLFKIKGRFRFECECAI
jgi:hypothetical protein